MDPVTPQEAVPSPRWTAIFALVSVALINQALPPSLSIGPNWLLTVIVAALTVPTVLTHRAGKHDWNQILGYAITSVETVALIGSVILLVSKLPTGEETAHDLLRAGALLWVSNVLTFALWYWRIDAGGPHRREAKPGHRVGDFLFPQMTLSEDDCNFEPNWQPHFIDYLFLAFNTSTALSPTDSPVLSRLGKVLMMAQSLIALTVITVLVSRAINIIR